MKLSTIQNIIVGVDLSEYSKLVVEQARALARKLEVPLTVVFCYMDTESYREIIMINRPKVAALYKTKIRSLYSLGSAEKIEVRFGRAEKAILSLANRIQNPLLIVGHQSGHFMRRFFLGSVAEQVVASSKFPVWVHRGNKLVLPKRILIPSDLSKNSEKTIAVAASFGKKLGGTTEILHVLQEPMPILDYEAWSSVYQAMKADDDRKVRRFKKNHPKLKTIRAAGNVANQIEDYSTKFDLVAITPRGNSKSRLPFGSVSAKLIRSSEKPILVVP